MFCKSLEKMFEEIFFLIKKLMFSKIAKKFIDNLLIIADQTQTMKNRL